MDIVTKNKCDDCKNKIRVPSTCEMSVELVKNTNKASFLYSSYCQHGNSHALSCLFLF